MRRRISFERARGVNMLKEINGDESHGHKEKIIFITPLMVYKIT
jgi:hypothetical protein